VATDDRCQTTDEHAILLLRYAQSTCGKNSLNIVDCASKPTDNESGGLCGPQIINLLSAPQQLCVHTSQGRDLIRAGFGVRRPASDIDNAAGQNVIY